MEVSFRFVGCWEFSIVDDVVRLFFNNVRVKSRLLGHFL